jgi:hypothetical protein
MVFFLAFFVGRGDPALHIRGRIRVRDARKVLYYNDFASTVTKPNRMREGISFFILIDPVCSSDISRGDQK